MSDRPSARSSEAPTAFDASRGVVPGGVERRATVRAPVSLPIRLWSAGGWWEGWTFDLSVGGVGCVVDGAAPLVTGQRVDASLELLGDERSSVVEVVRTFARRPASGPPQRGLGLRFALDDPTRDALIRSLVEPMTGGRAQARDRRRD